MEKKELEKAVKEQIENTIFYNIGTEEIDDDESNYEAGRRDAIYDFGEELFVAGANWRINSVWHDVKETPLYKFILIDMGERFDVIRIESDIWPYYVENYRAKRYVYIEDLLPTKED